MSHKIFLPRVVESPPPMGGSNETIDGGYMDVPSESPMCAIKFDRTHVEIPDVVWEHMIMYAIECEGSAGGFRAGDFATLDLVLRIVVRDPGRPGPGRPGRVGVFEWHWECDPLSEGPMKWAGWDATENPDPAAAAPVGRCTGDEATCTGLACTIKRRLREAGLLPPLVPAAAAAEACTYNGITVDNGPELVRGLALRKVLAARGIKTPEG